MDFSFPAERGVRFRPDIKTGRPRPLYCGWSVTKVYSPSFQCIRVVTLISMPYSVGLESAANAFLSAGFPTQFTLAVVILLLILIYTSSLHKDAADIPTRLPCFSIFAIIPFFRKRYDFLNWAFHATGQSVFQFQLLRVCKLISVDCICY